MKHSWKLSIMLTEFPGGNPPTLLPATWFRSIFDSVVNTCIAISLRSSLQTLLPVTALARLHGRTALPEEAAASFHEVFLLPLHHHRLHKEKISPKTRASHPGGSGITMLGSLLTARGGKGRMTPSVHMCIDSAAKGYMRMKDQAYASALGEWGKAPFQIQSRTARGSLPLRESLLLHLDTTSAGGEQSSLHTWFSEYTQRFSPNYYSKTATFTSCPPGQHLICSPSPCGKL